MVPKIPQAFCQQTGRRGLPEPQEPQNRRAANGQTSCEIGRRAAYRETAVRRDSGRIMKIVEIVMCFSPASALDIVRELLPQANSLETAALSGVESFALSSARSRQQLWQRENPLHSCDCKGGFATISDGC